MKTREQIKRKLDEVFEYRLKLRNRKFLAKRFFNCQYNKGLGCESEKTLHCCVHPSMMTNGSVQVCDNDEKAVKCPLYCGKYTKELIKSELMKEISDPKLCGMREPKIAVLLWVLTDENENNDDMIVEQMQEPKEKATIWQKCKKYVGLA